MEIIDISLPVTTCMLTYPGDTKPSFRPICEIERSGCNMTELLLSTHTGTHIDAPTHFLPNTPSIDELDLTIFLGMAQVVEVFGNTIDEETVEQRLGQGTQRVLFKTKNSDLLNENRFSKEHAHLTRGGAMALASKGVVLVGIDYITIERFGTPDFSVHKTLLKSGIPILEGINLSGVRPGYYTLVALPLKLKGLDGSPVRAVLISGDLPP